jgi:HEAT repeat protein
LIGKFQIFLARSAFLSFADLRDAAFERMLVSIGSNAPRPALHQTSATHGDLTRALAFRNRAFHETGNEAIAPKSSLRDRASDLATLVPSAVLSALTKALQEDALRQIAITALGKMGPAAAEAVPDLADVLRFGHTEDIRRSAVDALVQIGPAGGKTVQALTKALQEDALRQIAITALGKMGPAAAEAVPHLADVLLRFRHTEDIRRSAIEALAKIRTADFRTMQALINVLGEDQLRQNPANTLLTINSNSTEALVFALQSPNQNIRLDAAYLLGEIYKT